MMTWTTPRRSLRLATAAGVSLAAIGLLSACTRTDAGAGATVAQAGPAPMLVNCGPGQQPLIRHVPVNSAFVPQVECVQTAADVVSAHMPLASAQMGVQHYAPPVAAPAPVYAPAAPVYTAPAPVQATAARPVDSRVRPASHRVVYDDDVVEYRSPSKNRSWQKSAVIIGSSAGVGAGVGAATGGKKGALIGAAIGGGAATIWDQATRR